MINVSICQKKWLHCVLDLVLIHLHLKAERLRVERNAALVNLSKLLKDDERKKIWLDDANR